jgi:hypothetical protein
LVVRTLRLLDVARDTVTRDVGLGDNCSLETERDRETERETQRDRERERKTVKPPFPV